MQKRAFSLYDIEEFLREAGAEHVNEKAVVSLEEELEDTVKELVSEAQVYANYAGRQSISNADISMVEEIGRSSRVMMQPNRIKRKIVKRARPIRVYTNMGVAAPNL